MKVLLIILLLMIVSCKREKQRALVLGAAPIIIGDNIGNIISTQDKGVNTDILTYLDNPIITYKTKITDFKYFLVHTYENQQVEMYEELNSLPNGNVQISFLNNFDILLGSLEVNTQGYIGNIIKGDGTIDQLIVPDSVSDKFTCMKSKSFGECFTCAHKECDDDWRCYIMCKLAWEECAIGWIIGCVMRPDPKPGILVPIDTINKDNIIIDSTLIHQIDTIP